MLSQQIIPKAIDPHSCSIPVAGLAEPDPALLNDLLSARIMHDRAPHIGNGRPQGAGADLRPMLPKAMPVAMSLYLNRRKVDSLQMLFATVALANPN